MSLLTELPFMGPRVQLLDPRGGSGLPVYLRKPMGGSNCFWGGSVPVFLKKPMGGGGGGSNCFLGRVSTSISKEAYGGAGVQLLLGEGPFE